MKKLLLILLASITLSSCYNSDYQMSVQEAFPNARIFSIDNGGSNEYIVITKDSSVYFVRSNRIFSTKPSDKQYLFNLKTLR